VVACHNHCYVSERGLAKIHTEYSHEMLHTDDDGTGQGTSVRGTNGELSLLFSASNKARTSSSFKFGFSRCSRAMRMSCFLNTPSSAILIELKLLNGGVVGGFEKGESIIESRAASFCVKLCRGGRQP
jgi:hypothetical protein